MILEKENKTFADDKGVQHSYVELVVVSDDGSIRIPVVAKYVSQKALLAYLMK